MYIVFKHQIQNRNKQEIQKLKKELRYVSSIPLSQLHTVKINKVQKMNQEKIYSKIISKYDS